MHHADHVGSLIRPKSLVEARTAFLNGQLGKEALRDEEDKVIGDLIAMQEEVRVPSSFVFTSDDGVKSPGMPIPTVTAKLKRRDTLTTDDFKFLKQRTTRTAKATLPSPSANHFFSGDAGFAKSPYQTRVEFFADVCSIYQQEIADLEAAGCTFLQIDEVPIAVLCDPANADRVWARGENPDALIDDYIQAINDSVSKRHPGTTVYVHLCKGNAGKGQGAGGYDSVAERLFQLTNVDGFLLEYDTERAGSFAPLRFLLANKSAVLGLISTKIRDLEPVDEIRRRVDEAAKYASIERLGICPQCGFASSFRVDRFTSDDQKRKLAHVVETARRIWG